LFFHAWRPYSSNFLEIWAIDVLFFSDKFLIREVFDSGREMQILSFLGMVFIIE